ncbi:hypothetical protein [Pseudomonas putida]|uniref:Uncharacterized protein n=1 Tax=Pseudomonas putida TaxID=303 RepID=A0A8I1EAT2_PSEPU|nr:hypothetical protein [Pseudomonas putida]MBI6883049.1 hypothetical protein [Pseudomonas putida]
MTRSAIVGYQVQDSDGNNWADRPSFLILTEKTAINDLLEARKSGGFWTMIAILNGDVQDPSYEDESLEESANHLTELVLAARPLADLLFDHHPAGDIYHLQVDGGDVSRLKNALAPFTEIQNEAVSEAV